MRKFIDITGMTFGQWRAISYAGESKWMATCLSCGQTNIVIGWNLRSGHTTRCERCRFSEQMRHGHAPSGKPSKSYRAWRGMIMRCTDPKHKSFSGYGGRGIKVCERWNDFVMFLEDMGESPPGYMLDRIDYNGNYEPGNCRWVTPTVSAGNKRNNRLVLFNGKMALLSHVEKEQGRTQGSLFQLLKRHGWPQFDLSTLPKPVPRTFFKAL